MNQELLNNIKNEIYTSLIVKISRPAKKKLTFVTTDPAISLNGKTFVIGVQLQIESDVGRSFVGGIYLFEKQENDIWRYSWRFLPGDKVSELYYGERLSLAPCGKILTVQTDETVNIDFIRPSRTTRVKQRLFVFVKNSDNNFWYVKDSVVQEPDGTVRTTSAISFKSFSSKEPEVQKECTNRDKAALMYQDAAGTIPVTSCCQPIIEQKQSNSNMILALDELPEEVSKYIYSIFIESAFNSNESVFNFKTKAYTGIQNGEEILAIIVGTFRKVDYKILIPELFLFSKSSSRKWQKVRRIGINLLRDLESYISSGNKHPGDFAILEYKDLIKEFQSGKFAQSTEQPKGDDIIDDTKAVQKTLDNDIYKLPEEVMIAIDDNWSSALRTHKDEFKRLLGFAEDKTGLYVAVGFYSINENKITTAVMHKFVKMSHVDLLTMHDSWIHYGYNSIDSNHLATNTTIGILDPAELIAVKQLKKEELKMNQEHSQIKSQIEDCQENLPKEVQELLDGQWPHSTVVRGRCIRITGSRMNKGRLYVAVGLYSIDEQKIIVAAMYCFQLMPNEKWEYQKFAAIDLTKVDQEFGLKDPDEMIALKRLKLEEAKMQLHKDKIEQPIIETTADTSLELWQTAYPKTTKMKTSAKFEDLVTDLGKLGLRLTYSFNDKQHLFIAPYMIDHDSAVQTLLVEIE